jgi:hypothetical protein
VFGDENVGRLDVPVHDPRAVRHLERVRDLHAELDHPLRRERLACDSFLERPTLHQLHDDERRAILLAEVVDGANVRVVERRGGARLAHEAIERLPVVRQLHWEELHRVVAAEPGVLGLVDDALPPPPSLDRMR